MESVKLELQGEYSRRSGQPTDCCLAQRNPHLEPNLHDSVRKVLLSSPLFPEVSSKGHSASEELPYSKTLNNHHPYFTHLPGNAVTIHVALSFR